jgi:hypothetical protein
MAGEAYWGYWKHKVEQLWKELEDLKARVAELEGRGKRAPPARQSKPVLVPVKVARDSTAVPAAPVVTDSKDPVVKVLRGKGPMNVVDVNVALKDEGIEESVRDTLFNRLKPLMKKGVVVYDEGTQTFTAH